VELRDEVEEQLPAGLGEGQIAEFVEHDEVEPGQMIGNAPLSPGAGLGLQPVDQIDHVEEASTSTVADQRPGKTIVAGAVGDRLVSQPQRLGNGKDLTWSRITAAGQDVEDYVRRRNALIERLLAGGLDGAYPVGQDAGEDRHHLPVAIMCRLELAAYLLHG